MYVCVREEKDFRLGRVWNGDSISRVSGEKPAPEKTNVSAYFHAQQQAPQRLASLQNDPQKHANSTTRSINSNKSQQTTNSKLAAFWR